MKNIYIWIFLFVFHLSAFGQTASISGTVVNPNDLGVNEVTIDIYSANTDSLVASVLTDSDGKYEVDGLPLDSTYEITASKNANPSNGVSMYDIVLLRRHILGMIVLDDAFKLLAGDVNLERNITTLDMVLMRNVINKRESKFRVLASWRIFPKESIRREDNGSALEDFANSVTLNNLQGNVENIDFRAVKIGDINGDASVE